MVLLRSSALLLVVVALHNSISCAAKNIQSSNCRYYCAYGSEVYCCDDGSLTSEYGLLETGHTTQRLGRSSQNFHRNRIRDRDAEDAPHNGLFSIDARVNHRIRRDAEPAKVRRPNQAMRKRNKNNKRQRVKGKLPQMGFNYLPYRSNRNPGSLSAFVATEPNYVQNIPSVPEDPLNNLLMYSENHNNLELRQGYNASALSNILYNVGEEAPHVVRMSELGYPAQEHPYRYGVPVPAPVYISGPLKKNRNRYDREALPNEIPVSGARRNDLHTFPHHLHPLNFHPMSQLMNFPNNHELPPFVMNSRTPPSNHPLLLNPNHISEPPMKYPHNFNPLGSFRGPVGSILPQQMLPVRDNLRYSGIQQGETLGNALIAQALRSTVRNNSTQAKITQSNNSTAGYFPNVVFPNITLSNLLGSLPGYVGANQMIQSWFGQTGTVENNANKTRPNIDVLIQNPRRRVNFGPVHPLHQNMLPFMPPSNINTPFSHPLTPPLHLQPFRRNIHQLPRYPQQYHLPQTHPKIQRLNSEVTSPPQVSPGGITAENNIILPGPHQGHFLFRSPLNPNSGALYPVSLPGHISLPMNLISTPGIQNQFVQSFPGREFSSVLKPSTIIKLPDTTVRPTREATNFEPINPFTSFPKQNSTIHHLNLNIADHTPKPIRSEKVPPENIEDSSLRSNFITDSNDKISFPYEGFTDKNIEGPFSDLNDGNNIKWGNPVNSFISSVAPPAFGNINKTFGFSKEIPNFGVDHPSFLTGSLSNNNFNFDTSSQMFRDNVQQKPGNTAYKQHRYYPKFIPPSAELTSSKLQPPPFNPMHIHQPSQKPPPVTRSVSVSDKFTPPPFTPGSQKNATRYGYPQIHDNFSPPPVYYQQRTDTPKVKRYTDAGISSKPATNSYVPVLDRNEITDIYNHIASLRNMCPCLDEPKVITLHNNACQCPPLERLSALYEEHKKTFLNGLPYSEFLKLYGGAPKPASDASNYNLQNDNILLHSFNRGGEIEGVQYEPSDYIPFVTSQTSNEWIPMIHLNPSEEKPSSNMFLYPANK